MQQISDSEVPPLRLPPAFHLFVNRTASPPPQHRTADRPPGLGLRAAADLPPAAGALRPPGRRTSPRRDGGPWDGCAWFPAAQVAWALHKKRSFKKWQPSVGGARRLLFGRRVVKEGMGELQLWVGEWLFQSISFVGPRGH